MKSKQALVPKLRFGEFEGDWQSQCYSELSTKVGSGSTPTGGSKVYASSGIPFIRSQNVNQNTLLLDDLVYISQEIDDNMRGSRVQANDILLNITGASIGRSCVTPSKFTKGNVNQHVCIIRTNDANSPHFIQAHLASFRGKKLVLQGQAGGGREGLNFQSIRRFKLLLPTLPEQEKIAAFLTSVDDRIDQLKRNKSLLQDYKKGAMQKLFSQELRFKDEQGKDFPDWEEKKLEDVVERFSSGATPYRGKSEYYTGNIKWISSGELNYNTIYDTNEYISEQARAETNLRTHPPGTFLMAITGLEAAGTRGSCAITGITATTNQSCMAIYPKELLRTDFLFQWYKNFGERLAFRYCQGTKQQSYTAGILKIVPISLPKDLNEQIKIANFLSSLDQKIEQVDTQITQTQTFKKGLLQQMFV